MESLLFCLFALSSDLIIDNFALGNIDIETQNLSVHMQDTEMASFFLKCPCFIEIFAKE